MTYAQYSTGFKGGGVNPRPFYNVQAVPFRPETLDASEIGLKSQFFDNHLRLNLAAFYNKYKDIQLTLSDCTALFGAEGVPCILPANAGDADVKGGEAELNWQPLQPLEIDASLSYIDFKYTRVNPITGVSLNDVTPYTPKTKYSLGAQYEIPLGVAGFLTPRVDVAYQARMFTDAQNSTDAVIDGYTLLNAHLIWQSKGKDWQATLECQNLTDKLYYLSKLSGAGNGSGYTMGAPGIPRTVMFTVKRSF
jgi:iron complex outermembrane receptor protein